MVYLVSVKTREKIFEHEVQLVYWLAKASVVQGGEFICKLRPCVSCKIQATLQGGLYNL